MAVNLQISIIHLFVYKMLITVFVVMNQLLDLIVMLWLFFIEFFTALETPYGDGWTAQVVIWTKIDLQSKGTMAFTWQQKCSWTNLLHVYRNYYQISQGQMS